MADNTVLSVGSGGDQMRTLDDGTNKWPAGVSVYATTVSDGANVLQVVMPAFPMPVGFNTVKDGSGTLYAPLVDSDGHTQIDVLSSALPSGAATKANQDTANTILAVIAGDTTSIDGKITACDTGAVVVSSGAITETNSGTIAGDTTSLDGKVTACNTGAVVVASGAITETNSAAIKTSVEIMDDWDESDRAKINPIVGQAGIAAGAGAAGVTVPRVVLATDTTVPNVSGVIAHDAVIGGAGNPVLVGVEARSTEGTAVADADFTRLIADLVGKLITSPYAPSDLYWDGTGNKTDTSELSLEGTPGASAKLYLTWIAVANTSAVATEVIVLDGTGGAELARFSAPAGGGCNFGLPTPLVFTANKACIVKAADSVTTLYVTAGGYKGR